MSVLLIEDDLALAGPLADLLRAQGYRVEHVTDGREGLAAALSHDFNVLLVDRMLPGMDGLTLVKSLRRDKKTPVIYLTTMGGIDDRVRGLDAGGDDYLVKPFAFPELLARIRALARRSVSSETRLLHGDIEMDIARRTVSRQGRTVNLVAQEFRLLEFLLRNGDRVVTRKMLLENVWGIHFDPHTNVVESHISRLRSRLNAADERDAILTVRGVGYRLRNV